MTTNAPGVIHLRVCIKMQSQQTHIEFHMKNATAHRDHVPQKY